MKNKIAMFTISFLLLGCGQQWMKEAKRVEPATRKNVQLVYWGDVNLYEVKHQSHDYLVVRVSSGTSMVHSESCKCKAL